MKCLGLIPVILASLKAFELFWNEWASKQDNLKP